MLYPENAPTNTLIRPVVAVALFCDHCGREETFYLKDETATDEVYACSACESEKRYTVR
jgi:hypothetical protein